MIENFQGNKVWSSTLVRTAVILLCCVGVVGGLGCATYLASSSPNPRANNYYNNPVLTDTIFALARPDAALTKKIGREGSIAFLGKKHTYLLLEGGEKLESIARKLEGDKLTLEPNHRLYRKGNIIWGNISLRYRGSQDAAGLLGFIKDKSGSYSLSVAVKGTINPVAKLKTPLPDEFNMSREIAFYNPPDSSPPPDFGKLIIVPLAVVVDAALTPVYLLGFIVVVLGS